MITYIQQVIAIRRICCATIKLSGNMKVLVALAFLAVASALPEPRPIELPEPVGPEVDSSYVIRAPIDLASIADAIKVADAQVFEEADAPVDAVNFVDGPISEDAPYAVNFVDGPIDEDVPYAVNFVDAPVNEEVPEAENQLPEDFLSMVDISPMIVPEEVMKAVAEAMRLDEAPEAVNIVDAPVDNFDDAPVDNFDDAPVDNFDDAPVDSFAYAPVNEEAPVDAVNFVDSPMNEEVPEIQSIQLPEPMMPYAYMRSPEEGFDTPNEETADYSVNFVDAPIDDEVQQAPVDAVRVVEAAINEEPIFQQIAPSELESIRVVDAPLEAQEFAPEPEQFQPEYPSLYPDPTWR